MALSCQCGIRTQHYALVTFSNSHFYKVSWWSWGGKYPFSSSPLLYKIHFKRKMSAPCSHVSFFLGTAPNQSCSGRSTKYFHHFISTDHFVFSWQIENSPPTKQILMRVRLLSDPAWVADLTYRIILSPCLPFLSFFFFFFPSFKWSWHNCYSLLEAGRHFSFPELKNFSQQPGYKKQPACSERAMCSLALTLSVSHPCIPHWQPVFPEDSFNALWLVPDSF